MIGSDDFNQRLVLREFRCSLPLGKSAKTSVRRLSSSGQIEGKNAVYPVSLGCELAREWRECLAKRMSEVVSEEQAPQDIEVPEKVEERNELPESNVDDDASGVLSLYAKVDSTKKKNRRAAKFSDELQTPEPSSLPLEPYVVIDNSVFAGHPAVRQSQQSARL